MPAKILNLLDEGSWALMIEESNVRALQTYHGSMAKLDIDYYLSVGVKRYYKGYFEKAQLERVRDGIVRFLLDEDTYSRCVSDIHDVMEQLKYSGDAFVKLDLSGQFKLYCDLLCRYIAYYNSAITDTFYENVFTLVDSQLPSETRFAAKLVKDSLFATNNNELLSHMQTVDMLAISQRYLDGQSVDEDVEGFVEKYRSITISSGSPNGVTAAEVKGHLAQQTAESVREEKAFLDNLHFRYSNSESWSERTASAIKLNEATRRLIRNASEMSFLKILMREEFQKFKLTTRDLFLTALIKKIGKQQFDYMLIDEIAEFIRSGERVPEAEIAKRQSLTVFELKGNDITVLDAIPPHIEIEARDTSRGELSGDVLIGSGCKIYRVKKVEQHEEGLSSFDAFIETTEDKDAIAIITNVMRPYLVPKLRKFGALLTQYGGYTSHASVLCRELGINSMISIGGLLDTFETGDHIEIDFDQGTIRKLAEAGVAQSTTTETVIDLKRPQRGARREVGTKAANLMKINQVARIADGFAVTSQALKNIDDESVRKDIRDALQVMTCDQVVVRSSHESEDGKAGSYAGLFESYVNVDIADFDKIIDLMKSIRRSQRTVSIDEYGKVEGDMSVVVQEMISAEVSGVVLTSNPANGLDYILIEYIVGDLCHLMQGDVTPLSTYIRKTDILNGDESFVAYPAIIADSLVGLFRSLAMIAMDLERLFSQSLQIEWGMRGGIIYIFQARPH